MPLCPFISSVMGTRTHPLYHFTVSAKMTFLIKAGVYYTKYDQAVIRIFLKVIDSAEMSYGLRYFLVIIP